MIDPVAATYRRLDDARPFVRPTYNRFEVELLPHYDDPEVHVPGESARTLASVCSHLPSAGDSARSESGGSAIGYLIRARFATPNTVRDYLHRLIDSAF